jgi:DNA-binding NtrC family response regulator
MSLLLSLLLTLRTWAHSRAVLQLEILALRHQLQVLQRTRSRRVAFPNSPAVRPLCDVERQYILAVLQRNGGNRTQTAEQLRIAAATLFRKLKQYAAA